MTAETDAAPQIPAPLASWFDRRGWRVRAHQLAMLEAAQDGQHALLTAPTGSGKTLSGFLPTLLDLMDGEEREGLHTIYISPLKALATDVQRNLLSPIQELKLPIRVESRTGDTPSNRRARQKVRPPHVLLTTPESLNLLLSQPESFDMFAGVRRLVVDEVHAFATGKRGDLLALSMARLQRIAPGLTRAALSATVADPDEYRGWLAPDGDIDRVAHVEGEEGAPADVAIMLPTTPEGDPIRVPWAGHAAVYAVPQVMEEITRHKMTLVFTNTRFLAEFIFQRLWEINENTLPIGIHHGSLSTEARRKVEGAMAAGRMRALVCTASLDLGVDWGDIDCVIQMGAPKGSSRLLQRVGRAGHRLDTSSKALLVPGNRFEYLEAQAALDAVAEGVRDGEPFRRGGLDVLAQHIMTCACAAPFEEDGLLAEIRSALPYSALTQGDYRRVLDFCRDGGYALQAYDKFKRLTRDKDGTWRLSHPRFATQHRLNAGIIVDSGSLNVRFKNGKSLGTIDDGFASKITVGDTFFFAGQSLELLQMTAAEIVVRASKKAALIPSYGGARQPLTTHLAQRVREFLVDRAGWGRFPDDVREWLEMQDYRSRLPEPDQFLVETFPHHRLHYMVAYSFVGWNANQSLGMLLTRRMETLGLGPIGFNANDYSVAVWSIEPVADPRPLFSPDILREEFFDWVEGSHLLKRAFREVAVISGLVDRQHPGQRKSGRQVTFSTDLIFDVLRKYEPDHLLMDAAWSDARSTLTDIERLRDLLDTAAERILHVELERVSPLAVPALVLIGQEKVARGGTEDRLLLQEAELVDAAMRDDGRDVMDMQ